MYSTYILYYTTARKPASIVCINILLLCGDIESNPGPSSILSEHQVSNLEGLTFCPSQYEKPSAETLWCQTVNSIYIPELSYALRNLVKWLNLWLWHFTLLRQDCETRARARGGGLLSDSDIRYSMTIMPLYSINTAYLECWYLHLCLLDTRPTYIFICYRRPDADTNWAINILSNLLDFLDDIPLKDMIVCHNLNIALLSASNGKTFFLRIL